MESLGAKFVEMPLEEKTETAGGYATQLSEDAHKREVEMLHKHVKDSDVVITTALIPGKPAPVLVTEDMVRDMKPGSVIVDLAARTVATADRAGRRHSAGTTCALSGR